MQRREDQPLMMLSTAAIRNEKERKFVRKKSWPRWFTKRKSKPQCITSIIADAAFPKLATRAAATAVYNRPTRHLVLLHKKRPYDKGIYKKRPGDKGLYYANFMSTENEVVRLHRLHMMVAFKKLVDAKDDMTCELEYSIAREELYRDSALEKECSKLWSLVEKL